jgi:hypothetical protein
MRPKLKIILALSVAVVAALFYFRVTEAVPYFLEIPASQVAEYEPVNVYRSWSSAGWKLAYWRESGPAFSHDTYHLLLQKSDRFYELENFTAIDKQGSTFWDVDVLGNALYVHENRRFCPSHWIHLDVLIHGWLRQAFTMQSLGGWKAISPPTGVEVPANAPAGEVYRLQNGHLQDAGNLLWNDLFDRLDSGDYYIAPPGTGNAVSIDLTTVGTDKYKPQQERIVRP